MANLAGILPFFCFFFVGNSGVKPHVMMRDFWGFQLKKLLISKAGVFFCWTVFVRLFTGKVGRIYSNIGPTMQRSVGFLG